MLAAYTPGPLAAIAVVSLYGGIDLVGGFKNPPPPDPLDIPDVEEKLIGGTPDRFPDLSRAGTVFTYVTRRQPATLLICGARDNLVESKYGAALRDSLAAKGTTVVILEIPWANHAFDEVFNGPSNQLALYHTERFLAWALGTPWQRESRPAQHAHRIDPRRSARGQPARDDRHGCEQHDHADERHGVGGAHAEHQPLEQTRQRE